MKTLIGLGNPGNEYANTRHNVAWMFLDYLLAGQNDFSLEKKLLSETVEVVLDGEKLLLVKPQTFMNESGQAVRKIIDWRAADTHTDMAIVHDDLDITLGQFKLQKAKGPKVHNGILSIEQHLRTVDFYRLRIGIENRNTENRIDGKAYVLQSFTLLERELLQETFEKMKEDVTNWAKMG